MQRIIARLLLLFALVGNLVPLALAATIPESHACCRRMAHHCHSMQADSGELTFHDSSCCNHDCCRAVTTSQWACFEPTIAPRVAQKIEIAGVSRPSPAPVNEFVASQSTRAPPAC
jgi:hypothetical protein